MKYIFYGMIILFCGGCGMVNRSCATWEGHSFECVEGVQYVQFPSGASVLYNQDGSVTRCQHK